MVLSVSEDIEQLGSSSTASINQWSRRILEMETINMYHPTVIPFWGETCNCTSYTNGHKEEDRNACPAAQDRTQVSHVMENHSAETGAGVGLSSEVPGCSCRGPVFNSQHQRSSQPICNSSSNGADALFWPPGTRHRCGTQINMYKTPKHIT